MKKQYKISRANTPIRWRDHYNALIETVEAYRVVDCPIELFITKNENGCYYRVTEQRSGMSMPGESSRTRQGAYRSMIKRMFPIVAAKIASNSMSDLHDPLNRYKYSKEEIRSFLQHIQDLNHE